MIAGCGPSAAYEELQGESGGKEAEVTEAKDTVVMAVSTDPANVSPVSASTVDSCPITYNVYIRLLYVDGSDYVMEAAKSVEYEDDTHILVELRDDVYDELGNNMKASDVLFSMKLCLEGAGSNPTYLDSLDHVSVQEVPNYMLYGMMFNCSADSVFHSKEARQAVAYAVNKEALLATAMEGMGKECISAATTDFNDYSDQWTEKAKELDDYYGYNLDKAKELAQSSGLTGQTVQLTYTSSQPVQKMMAETDWDISFQIYGSLVNSALACMNTFIVAMNLVHLDGELYEDISSRISEGVSVTDTKERIALTNELMGLINEEVPIYGLCETSAMYGRADSLNDIECKILYFPDFTKLAYK